MERRVLLVASSFEDVALSVSSNEKVAGREADRLYYPLGFAYLHSCLEFHGSRVRNLFLNNYSFESCFNRVVREIGEFSPGIVALQILTQNRVSSYRLIEYIHNNYPHIKIIVGGIHSTLMYNQLLGKYPYIIVVIGEGERTFPELVETLSSERRDMAEIDGLAFFDGTSVVKTKPRELIQNLDTLPFPHHSTYFEGERDFSSLLTGRGCPFSCSFCVLSSITMRKVRYRSIKNTVAEVQYLITKFPQVKRNWIHDDTFFLDNKRALRFCDEIVRQGIKTSFICSGRMKPLSKELVDKLEQANFKKVIFGLESGCNEVLRASHKSITQQDAINAFKLFADSPIQLTALLIVGLPGETAETVMETAHFVKTLQRIKYTHYESNLNVLMIYPGTEVYEIAKAKGQLDDDFWLSDEPTPLFTAEHSKEELFEFKRMLVNHISLNRILSPGGFKAQFTMLPYIVKFLLFHLKDAKATSRWKGDARRESPLCHPRKHY